MSATDILFIFQWWVTLLVIGAVFFSVTQNIFSFFNDKGYIFSKILGIAVISYLAFISGVLHISEFSRWELIIILIISFIVCNYIWKNNKNIPWRWVIFEEIIFFFCLYIWSFVRSTSPDIHGLEKYMDFGFINSILRSKYFPPTDMWYPPYPINYYYFGHLSTAVLTKITNIPSEISFNLMLSTIFAFTFTGTFSIGVSLLSTFFKYEIPNPKSETDINVQNQKKNNHSNLSILNLFRYSKFDIKIFIGGLLTALLTTFAGNLHTLYTFFKPYANENPVPPWKLAFSPLTFPNQYWYPNATRFIYHTIHEFPIYSFVVSDLHGHVLDIPFVLLTIAFLLSFMAKSQIINTKYKILNTVFIGFLLAVMYMTNAWDGLIYLMLTVFIIFYLEYYRVKNDFANNTTNNPILKILPINKNTNNFRHFLLNSSGVDLFIGLFEYLFITAIAFLLFSLPFSHFFDTGEIVHGIGILCMPNFLTNIGKIGPFLFEANHCQKSPWWQLIILYGFFYFWVITFILSFLKKNSKPKSLSSKKNQKLNNQNLKPIEHTIFDHFNLFKNLKFDIKNLNIGDTFVLLLITLSTLLIIIPEFFYLKDIYPAHYRANTMFKLVYQSFIMLSLCSGYIIVRTITNIKYPADAKAMAGKQISNVKKLINWKLVVLVFIGSIGLFLVGIYPYFSIMSYYGNLQTHYGLNGTAYLSKQYPDDAKAVAWINKNIQGRPVILEAQGDSYTDYARVSANTGLPTVLGWTVHEWLWRGSYDPLPERFNDVQHLYETGDIFLAKQIILKYNIKYIFVGTLEKQKYTSLNERKFLQLGKRVFQSGQTSIYRIN